MKLKSNQEILEFLVYFAALLLLAISFIGGVASVVEGNSIGDSFSGAIPSAIILLVVIDANQDRRKRKNRNIEEAEQEDNEAIAALQRVRDSDNDLDATLNIFEAWKENINRRNR